MKKEKLRAKIDQKIEKKNAEYEKELTKKTEPQIDREVEETIETEIEARVLEKVESEFGKPLTSEPVTPSSIVARFANYFRLCLYGVCRQLLTVALMLMHTYKNINVLQR